MRRLTGFTLALATTALLGCEAETEDDAAVTPGQELPAEQPDVPDETLVSVSEFEAVGDAGSAGAVPVRGTAEVRRVTDDGSLELHVRIEGLTEGDHAWHIHGAPCGQQGGIVVPLSGAGAQEGIHGDLDVGSDGVVEQRVTIAAEHLRNLQLETPHALNVHRGSGDNPGPAVACANIGGPSSGTAGASGTTPRTGS